MYSDLRLSNIISHRTRDVDHLQKSALLTLERGSEEVVTYRDIELVSTRTY
jgi:hypothetical protein